MKKIIICILAVSLLLSSFSVASYADESNDGYCVTPYSDKSKENNNG